ncbi:hypothetical protein [Clostridium sp. MSJ-8]|nr:hypothetical protein [Clostridium sp. MSJ-8]
MNTSIINEKNTQVNIFNNNTCCCCSNTIIYYYSFFSCIKSY